MLLTANAQGTRLAGLEHMWLLWLSLSAIQANNGLSKTVVRLADFLVHVAYYLE